MNISIQFLILILILYICLTSDTSNAEKGIQSNNQNLSSLSFVPDLIQKYAVNIEEQSTFKLKPRSRLTLFLNSTQSSKGQVFMDYSSTFPFLTCLLDYSTRCTQQKQLHKLHEGTVSINPERISNGIELQNHHETIYIKISIRFYFIPKECNVLVDRKLQRKQVSNYVCFTHVVQQQQDFELLIEPQSFINLKYQFELCEVITNVQMSQNNRFLITSTMVADKCNGKRLKKLTINIKVLNLTEYSTNNNAFYLLIGLQYPQDSILLPDGIGYKSKISGSTPKVFFYELLNMINTTINVQSKENIAIYAKVVDESFVEDSVPSQKNYDFSSKQFFLLNRFKPYIIIQTQKLLSFKCDNCYLVISVQLVKPQVGSADIIMEVVQHYSTLYPGIAKYKYLPKDSAAYFKYVSLKDQRLYFEVSDNNQYCTKIYLGNDMNPSEANHILKYEKRQIVYSARRNEVLYVGVVAIDNCAFSLVFYESTHNITFLEKGSMGFLNLEEGKERVYLIRADDSQYLKFISLQIYGSVQIAVNRTTLEYINNLKGYDLNLSSFAKKSQYNNILILDSKEQQFCKRCYYLVGIVAKKHTQSTFFYGDQATSIPIRDKIINDYIPHKGAVVKGQYYGSQKSQIQVTVRSGQLKLSIHNKKKRYQQTFQQSEDVYKDKFDLEIKEQGLIDKLIYLVTQDPITVEFQALEDNTVYTIQFKQIEDSNDDNKDDDDSTVKYRNTSIAAGSPLFQVIEPQQTLCVSGYLRDKKERIIITSDYSQRQKLDRLNISAEINDKKVDISFEKAQNIISISFPSLSNYLMSAAVQFDLFISIPLSNVWVSIIQDEEFTLLPSEVQALVQNQYTFITHSQSDLIVDIFQCKGKSDLIYGSSIVNLKKNKSQAQLDMIGISNQAHAIRITQNSTMFFQVIAPKAIIRWFPLATEKHIGTGYLDYQIGHLIYKSVINGIELNWGSLSMLKKSNSSIDSVSYHLFVSNSEDDLKASSQCQLSGAFNVLRKDDAIEKSRSLLLNSTHSYILDRNQLIAKFSSSSLFATVIADVILTPQINKSQNESSERYRFIYPIIQIPSELLTLSYIDKVNSMGTTQILALILLTLVAVTILTYFCLNKIMPLLGVLKTRWLIQEQPSQNQSPVNEEHPGLVEVPASSDRNFTPHQQELMEKDEYIEVK